MPSSAALKTVVEIRVEVSARGRRRGRVREVDAVHRLPVVGRHHLDCVPRTAVEERAVRPLADALLAADAEVRVNLYPPEGRVVFVGNPEHTRINGTVLDARGRARTARAAIGGDGEYARLLLARRLAVADRHRPVLFDYSNHSLLRVPRS